MKKIICMFLLCVVLFSLSGCSMTKEHIPEIIENYDKYSEILSDKGIESKVEDAAAKLNKFANKNGKVLTVFSPDGRQYIFHNIDKYYTDYPTFRGDACRIEWEIDRPFNGTPVKCIVSLWIQFRNKTTHVRVSYHNSYPSDNYKFGNCSYNYLDGDFTPDLVEREKSSFSHTDDQVRDRRIKTFVSAEELSACYKQACEYYEILCSVLED